MPFPYPFGQKAQDTAEVSLEETSDQADYNIALPEPEEVLSPQETQTLQQPSFSLPTTMALPVHILAGNTKIRTQNSVLVIEHFNKKTIQRPLALVSALHIHGWATVTSPCIRTLLGQNTPIIWRSPSGYPVGYSAPLNSAGLETRRGQFWAASQPEQGLSLARQFVVSKIINMRVFLRRKQGAAVQKIVQRLERSAQNATTAQSMSQLLGIEGSATAQYFSVFNAVLSDEGKTMTFDKRSRRPPRNETNALLSYCYAVLLGECLCAVVAAGLDPRQGFLHVTRAGRPALALDLMEAFRPVIADAVVLAGLNRGQFGEKSFSEKDEADTTYSLTDKARRALLAALEKRLSVQIQTSGEQSGQTYRQLIGSEARRLASALGSHQDFKSWRQS